MKNNNELLTSLKPTLMTLMVLKVKQWTNMDDGWTLAFEREKIFPPTEFHRQHKYLYQNTVNSLIVTSSHG